MQTIDGRKSGFAFFFQIDNFVFNIHINFKKILITYRIFLIETDVKQDHGIFVRVFTLPVYQKSASIQRVAFAERKLGKREPDED